MAAIIGKVRTVGSTLWNHKKKAIFFSGVAVYGLNWISLSNRDGRIRLFYALEAKKYGDQPISPADALKKVTVLINEDANGRKVADCFKKNALPLLNLAGVDVTLLQSEMEALGRALDRSETDCIYVVGGDGTVSHLVSGMCSSTGARPPLCVFPGGRHNVFLRRLIPAIFGEVNDVRRYCESAMAILEETRRDVYPMKCSVIDNTNADESKTIYVLSDVSAGWLEHCEQRKPKLWYFGALRDRIVYVLEFLKRFPEPLSVCLAYTDFCPGCNRCRRSVEERAREYASNTKNGETRQQQRRGGWLSGLLGSWNTSKTSTRREVSDLIDYSNVINENCGASHSLTLDTANFDVACIQKKDCCVLELSAGRPFFSRLDAIRVGWSKESVAHDNNSSANNPGENEQVNERTYVQTHIPASAITLSFTHMPTFIQKLAIAGDWATLENFSEKSLRLTASDRRLQLYVPRTTKSRIDLENC